VIELLFKRALYRALAEIRRIHSGGVSPETSTTPPSPATRLPLEVVQIIVGYLTYDARSLRACTLTCYSWYIAAAPHLHHTLVIVYSSFHRKPRCPQFHTEDSAVFWTLLAHRQKSRPQRTQGILSAIYFVGHFQHLQDLELTYDWAHTRKEPADNLTLVPPFVPPTEGWLPLTNFTRVCLLKEMIDLFGGLQFRSVHLFNVKGMRLLLGACARTLEIAVLYPTDPRGEQLSSNGVQVSSNVLVAKSSLQDFDLSRNMSLRTLEFPASSIDRTLNDGPPGATLSFCKHVPSTATSSAFFRVIILRWNCDFPGINPYLPYPCEMSQADKAEEAHDTIGDSSYSARRIKCGTSSRC